VRVPKIHPRSILQRANYSAHALRPGVLYKLAVALVFVELPEYKLSTSRYPGPDESNYRANTSSLLVAILGRINPITVITQALY
jgi:hypothetical protein